MKPISLGVCRGSVVPIGNHSPLDNIPPYAIISKGNPV